MVDEDVITKEQLSIHSKIIGEARPILVHLPDGYEESQEKYPVVYLLDGGYKARFANTTATIQLLYDAGQIPNMIVIGIEDTDHGETSSLSKSGGGEEEQITF